MELRVNNPNSQVRSCQFGFLKIAGFVSSRGRGGHGCGVGSGRGSRRGAQARSQGAEPRHGARTCSHVGSQVFVAFQWHSAMTRSRSNSQRRRLESPNQPPDHQVATFVSLNDIRKAQGWSEERMWPSSGILGPPVAGALAARFIVGKVG